MKLISLLKPKDLYLLLIGNKKNLRNILIIVVVALTAAYFAYKKYGVPKIKNKTGDVKHNVNKELVKADQSAKIYYFYTEWCPYCKKARPEWDKFKDIYKDETVNGNKLEFIEIDCDKDEGTAKQFEVESYPTIKLTNNGSIVQYDAKPKFETLEEFVKTSL
jgi:thiol-disulfide isomerase/thioredoxin